MFKKLPVPFISSRGFECGQACAAMMIRYYYPNFEPNFDQINKIIHHQKGKYTFPLQSAVLLDNFGIKVKCFSADDYKTTKEEPEIFRRWYGKEYDEQIKNVYINGYNWMVQEGKRKNLFEKRKTSFSEILGYFSKGYIVNLIVDWKTLGDKKGNYEGHSVIISGI
ncbi:C39 family peptidase, partial [Candidatus Gottesmanbacteria bacterium]|nr:C39 family peptidase [Candidatus Gottesmanbacteria bacterium]